VAFEIRFGRQPVRGGDGTVQDILVATWPARSASGAGNLERFLEFERLQAPPAPAAPAASAAAAAAEQRTDRGDPVRRRRDDAIQTRLLATPGDLDDLAWQRTSHEAMPALLVSNAVGARAKAGDGDGAKVSGSAGHGKPWLQVVQ
jgi:hypothetical protein